MFVFVRALRCERALDPIGRTSPAFSARPPNGPMRLMRLVARLPKIGGTSKPPLTARHARAPAKRSPNLRVSPARSVNAACMGTGALPLVSANVAPATAQVTSVLASSSGPINVTSSAAADAGLPTRRFARMCEYSSIGPATGTPCDCAPQRPRSWTVVNIPGRVTVSAGVTTAGSRDGDTARKRTRSPVLKRKGSARSGS